MLTLHVVSFLLYLAGNAQVSPGSFQESDSLRPNIRDSTAAEPPKEDFPAPFHFSWLTHVPGDLASFGKAPFEKKNLLTIGFVTATTAILISHDQQISFGVANVSKQIGLDRKAEFDKVLAISHKTLLKSPDNLNSGFYELGEGITTMALAGGFYMLGKINHNNRSLQTASDLAETYLTMGITIQLIKHITGRQAPTQASSPGGVWHFFPPVKAYQRNSTFYGAFPSGHLATMMGTVTVLAENYPEKKWIRPVGYLLTGLTGWAMVNNGVHWAGDFPLGIAIGYLSGKITTMRHQHRAALKTVPL